MSESRSERARRWLQPPLLCLVTDGQRQGADLVERVAAAVDGGARLVQVREKHRPAGELFELVQALHARIAGRAALLVNDRLDVALAAGAEGVHLPAAGLPPRAARRLAVSSLLGSSVHDPHEAERVASEGVDYLILGTIFATATHPDVAPGGLDLVQQARALVSLPLLAIGGIRAENAASVVAAGADGVAVVSAVLGAPDPALAAAQLVQAINEGWSRRVGHLATTGVGGCA